MKSKSRKALPIRCPSCEQGLQVRQLECTQCETQIHGDYALPALLMLGRADQRFVTDFVLANGSLKALAKEMGVSYPTVRGRLNDIIEHLQRVAAAPKDH